MGISVKDALTLPGLNKARLLAGKKGLNKIIERVSVVEAPDFKAYKSLVKEGDFFITSFYAVKNDEHLQLKAVETLLSCGSSGLVVIDLYFKDLSKEIKNFADEASFPIMILPESVPYAEVITNVMDAIIRQKDNLIKEMRINNILQNGRTKNEIIEMALSINRNFRKNVVCAYCINTDGLLDSFVSLKNYSEKFKTWEIINYQKGILIIMTFENNPENLVKYLINEIMDIISLKGKTFKIGVSDVHEGLEFLNLSIKEALIAADASDRISQSCIVNYRDLGIYKLLMPLRDKAEIQNFYNEIIPPISIYDQKYNTKLFETAVAFVENDGNIKKTARALFQHENTIRYRLNRIKEILNMENQEGSFYEQLSIAVKIHKLLF